MASELKIVDCTNFEKVGNFRRKFGLDTDKLPQVPDSQQFLFRYGHIMEEMTELLQAYRTRRIFDMADALADILYVVYGTAYDCGIPIDAVFNEVHRANMEKVRATDESGKRGSKFDVVKPDGWQPPDLHRVMAQYVRSRE